MFKKIVFFILDTVVIMYIIFYVKHVIKPPHFYYVHNYIIQIGRSDI